MREPEGQADPHVLRVAGTFISLPGHLGPAAVNDRRDERHRHAGRWRVDDREGAEHALGGQPRRPKSVPEQVAQALRRSK